MTRAEVFYKILLRPQIPFGRLDGRVAQEQLNLLKLAARRATQLRAGSTSIMRGNARNAGCVRVPPELRRLEDHLGKVPL